jgi:hypothetical protein
MKRGVAPDCWAFWIGAAFQQNPHSLHLVFDDRVLKRGPATVIKVRKHKLQVNG